MRGGLLLLVVGVFLLYLGASGKIKCLSLVWQCAIGDTGSCSCGGSSVGSGSGGSIALPLLPPIPRLPGM